MNMLLLLALLLSQAAYADDSNYEHLTQNLKHSQARAGAWIKKLTGATDPSMGFAPQKNSSSEHEDLRPLFVTHDELKSVVIPPGRLVFAHTVTRLVVASDGSPAVLEITPDQAGLSQLRLLGVARPSSNPGRLIIELTQLITRTGKSVTVHATALDDTGAYGLVAQVFSSKALAVAGAMASSFVSGFAASQQTQSTNAFGFNQVQPSSRNGILQGVAQSAADQTKRLIDDSTTEKPVLVVDPQTPVTVLIQEEVRL